MNYTAYKTAAELIEELNGTAFSVVIVESGGSVHYSVLYESVARFSSPDINDILANLKLLMGVIAFDESFSHTRVQAARRAYG